MITICTLSDKRCVQEKEQERKGEKKNMQANEQN